MGHVRTPQADSDLDDIWYYIATRSGSIETADRLVDSITDRFRLLAMHPNIVPAMRTCAPDCEAFPSGSTLSSIESRTKTR